MTKNQNKEITKEWSSISSPIIVTAIVTIIMVITMKPFFFYFSVKETYNILNSLIKMINVSTLFIWNNINKHYHL